MKVIDVPLDQIDVGERRRLDYGDIGALAQGIQRVGLLEPIIVDRNGSNRYRLIAGERRLRAVTTLKWKAIPANLREHMTDDQLREVELEENENRKSLTQRERERTFVAAKKVVEAAKKAEELLAQSGPKPDQKGTKGGRPNEPDSTRAIAAALGTSRQSVERAQKQVTISERYPFLQPWRQADVLKFEQHLKRLPSGEDARLCDFIVQACAPMPPRADRAIEFAEVMTAKTAKARGVIYDLFESNDKRDRNLAVTRALQRPPMPDARMSMLKDALQLLHKAHNPPYDKDPQAQNIESVWTQTQIIFTEIRNRYEQLKKDEERHAQGDLR